MKLLKKLDILSDVTHLLFLDIEGTQYHHEVIEIGAILVQVDANLSIMPKSHGIRFKVMCKAHEPVGKIVSQITGLTENTVRTKGIHFDLAMHKLNKLIGQLGKSLAIVTFGEQDRFMLERSASFYPEDSFINAFVPYLTNRIFDFSVFITQYVRNENYLPCSLLKLLEIFHVKPATPAHDPLNDAINLMNLYKKMIEEPKIMAEQYIRYIRSNPQAASHNPVVLEIIKRLFSGQTSTYSDLKKALIDYFA